MGGDLRVPSLPRADFLWAGLGSFFVSSSAVNPALTIIANALRVGHHLLERLA